MKKTAIFIFLLAIGAFVANAQNDTKTDKTQTETKSSDGVSTNHDANNNNGAISTDEGTMGTKLMISDLPKVVSESISTQNQGWTPQEVYKIDYQGTPAYKVKVSKGQESKFLVYDASGKLLKTKDAGSKTSGSSTGSGSSTDTETR